MVPLLTLSILCGYGAALWWLLRRESVSALIGVAALFSLALALRLAMFGQFPAGLNEDEPKILHCASIALEQGWLWREGCTGIPALLNILFQAQLVPLLGPGQWSIRLYSMLASSLAVPAAFAFGRGMNLRIGPSLALAALVACLPWSIFFGRISIGGELVFHEMLLLAALSRLAFADGDWPETAIGGFGQWLLLYDYFCGRALLPLGVLAAVAARGRRRFLCLAVPAVALLGFVPHLLTHPQNVAGGIILKLWHPGLSKSPLATLASQTSRALAALATPTGLDGWLTVRSAAMHPPLVLAVAGLGVLPMLRRPRLALFIAGGFALGLTPAILSAAGGGPSAHRMLMAYPFIAASAAMALNAIAWHRVRAVATAAFVAVAAVQGVYLFFSPAAWPRESRSQFDADRTAAVEAIPPPPHPRLIVQQQLGYFFDPHKQIDKAYELLRVENWLPRNGEATIYVFDSDAAPLRSMYLHLFGPRRVELFERAFLVRLEARDWSWLKRHGWSYRARCGDRVLQGQVPALYHPLHLTFGAMHCDRPVEHVWRGRWNGPSAWMNLHFSGTAVVTAGSRDPRSGQGGRANLLFEVSHGDPVTIEVTSMHPPDPSPEAELFEVTFAGEEIPPWEQIDPVDPAPISAGTTPEQSTP